MSIQEYLCPDDGLQEVFQRGIEVRQEWGCPTCSRVIPHVMSNFSRFNIQRGWDEKANDYQRNPYDQAKAQLANLDREDQEHNGARPLKITEEAIQETARQIDVANQKPDDLHGMAVHRAAHQRAKANRKKA